MRDLYRREIRCDIRGLEILDKDWAEVSERLGMFLILCAFWGLIIWIALAAIQ